ncbi:MAG TPA: ABC transporter permease [Verrucomicrobiae bacterium]|nr:ABC transporter permease [Verrucomicrobiae bacterium]
MPDPKKPDFRSEVRLRVARLNLEPTREAAIVEEMAQHLEQRYEELIAGGANSVTAQEAVLRELSEGSRLERDLLRVEQQVPFEPAPPTTPGLSRAFLRLSKDLRYAFRGLRLNPAFSAVAILSLALGIGANTSIFQLLDAVTLRSLPVKAPNELALIRMPGAKGRTGSIHGSAPIFSYPIWEQIRDNQQAFSGLAVWYSTGFNMANGGRVRGARGLFVNGDFFNALGVRPQLGRVFSAADDYRGCGLPGAVISYGYWQKEFGGKESVVGSKLMVEGHPVEVIGVTPPGFYGLEVGRSYDVAVPLCSETLVDGEFAILDRRDGWWLAIIGRLNPGWSFARATAQLEAISPAIFNATLPASYQPQLAKQFLEWKLAAEPAGTGISSLRRAYANPLWILLAIAGTVLLIACANLANLMFARANAREREIAVRLALGASRMRLLQQLLMESLLLAGIGAIAGILLAQVLTRILVSFLGTQFGNVTLNLGLDWRVLGFTAAVAIMTCLLFGLMPAIKSTATPPIVAMKAGSRGITAGRERFGIRRILVVVQVAMSMVLLVGAFLFVRSFQKLASLDAGLRQTGILVADFDFTQINIPVAERNSFKQNLADRLHALPGVESAAAVQVVPFSGNIWNEDVHFDNAGQDVHEIVNFNRITPGFFRTMDIALVKGRDFGPENTLNSPAVAIVNESFTHKVLKDAEPLGRIFRVEEGAGKPQSAYQIIGVVKDTKYYDMREDFSPIAYLARSQDKKPDGVTSVVLRSDISVESLTSSVERTTAEINPAIGIQFSVFKSQVRDTMQRERLMASLSGFFGLLAGLLATIGLYGVISYMVVRRRNEIGIRMALGAGRGRVLSLIMREAAILLAIGLAAGTALSFVSTQAAASLLFGLKPRDPLTLALAAFALALIAAAASYLPAFRAARIHPTEALREE